MPGAEIVQRRMDRCSPPAEYLSACNTGGRVFIAHCVSGTVDKKVQVADHSDIHKIYTLIIALL